MSNLIIFFDETPIIPSEGSVKFYFGFEDHDFSTGHLINTYVTDSELRKLQQCINFDDHFDMAIEVVYPQRVIDVYLIPYCARVTLPKFREITGKDVKFTFITNELIEQRVMRMEKYDISIEVLSYICDTITYCLSAEENYHRTYEQKFDDCHLSIDYAPRIEEYRRKITCRSPAIYKYLFKLNKEMHKLIEQSKDSEDLATKLSTTVLCPEQSGESVHSPSPIPETEERIPREHDEEETDFSNETEHVLSQIDFEARD